LTTAFDPFRYNVHPRPGMNKLLTFLFLIPALSVLKAGTNDSPQIVISDSSLPSLPDTSFVRSGTAGGLSGGALLEIGGMNAEGKPVAEALVLPLESGTNSSWKKIPLPEVPSWAAVAQNGEELILAGGIIGGSTTAKVTAFRWDGTNVARRELPPLPAPLAGAGAAVLDGKLHVIGGIRSLDSREASREMLVLDLSSPQSKWQQLEPIPGSGKVLPMVTAQYDLLQVIGGRIPDEHGFRASKEVFFYRTKPAEGTTLIGWTRASDAPVAIAAGKAAPSGQAHTIILGADTTPVTDSPLSLGTTDRSPTLLFHAVTDAWVEAGAALSFLNPSLAKNPDGSLILFGAKGMTRPLAVATPRTTRNLNWADYLMILLYFFFIGYIGYYFRHQKSAAEYSLGNRQTPWWAAGISMFATAASAISFMAVPALAFASNLVWLFPLIVFIPVYFFQSRITYPILRRLEITSTFEYLERRFNTPLRLIASFLQIVFQTFGRSSIVLVLPSIAISATTGLDVRWSVLIMGVLTTVYTSIGGFEAVTWTLVFQGILKALAPIVVVWICIAGLPGGLHEFFVINATHHKFDFAILGWDVAFPLVWVMMLRVFLEQTIWQAGDQAVIQRVFASKDDEIRKVTAMTFSCGAFIGILVTAMGLAIFAYFHAHPEKFDAASTIDQIVPLFVVQGMPHGLVGIVVAAIFASAMATVAGAMNSVATIFTVDFYERWFPKAEDKANLRMMRLSTMGTGVAATLIALWLTTLNLKSIMVTWTIVQSLLSGGVVGIFALGMFSTRANSGGAVCGALMSIALGLYVKFFTPIHWAFLLPILIFSAMIIGYLCSFLFRSQSKDLTGLTIYHQIRRDSAS
jgi:SSS family solute:Na+ symporter